MAHDYVLGSYTSAARISSMVLQEMGTFKKLNNEKTRHKQREHRMSTYSLPFVCVNFLVLHFFKVSTRNFTN